VVLAELAESLVRLGQREEALAAAEEAGAEAVRLGLPFLRERTQRLIAEAGSRGDSPALPG
jgi:hypothetical protein